MTVTFDHVSACYGRRTILEDVSFTAHSGGITVLIGRNGAGKSTLLSCLTGGKRDYGGTITLDGADIRHLSAPRRARLCACLPQILPRPHVTVRELAAFGRAPYAPLGHLSREDRQAAEAALEAVGLAPMADAFVDLLSGGERKKAFFAMTLAQDTPLILLDEPTAHLDTVSRFEFLDLVTHLRSTLGKTFLVVMHELPEVLRCADRIVALDGGRLVFNGDARECLAQEIPQRYFRIRVSGTAEEGYAVGPLAPGKSAPAPSGIRDSQAC